MPDLIGEDALKWLREVCPPFRLKEDEPEPEQDTMNAHSNISREND